MKKLTKQILKEMVLVELSSVGLLSEAKLGVRKITPKDYTRNITFGENQINNSTISQLILNNPEAKKLMEENGRLSKKLSKIMQEKLQ